MNEIVTMNFNDNTIRHYKDDKGAIWFVANDVMSALGIKSQRHALRKLKNTHVMEAPLPSPSGIQKYSVVSEPGLYSLIMESNKPSAKQFQEWVTEEVLPSIRKTGSYSTQTEDPRMTQAKMILKYTEHMIEQEKVNNELKLKNAVLESRVNNVDKTVTQLVRHRKGGDTLPDGMITLKKLRSKYFNGVTENIVSKYLKAKNHPSEPYTYVIDGVEYPSFCYEQEGASQAARMFFSELEFENDMPKNIRVNHPLIETSFWLSKDTTPIYIQEALLKNTNLTLIK